jgi:hypothetical protein
MPRDALARLRWSLMLAAVIGVVGLALADPALAGPCPPPQRVCLPEEPAPPPPGQDGISNLDVHVGDAGAEALQALIGAELTGPLAALAPDAGLARLLTTVVVRSVETPLYGAMVALADGLLSAALLAALIRVMALRAQGQAAEGWGELLGRFLLAAAGVHLLHHGLPLLVGLSNALARLGGGRIGEFYAFGAPADGLGGALVTLVVAILFGLLLIQAFGRLALINLLALAGPVAMVGFVLPGARAWPGRWARLLVAATFAHALQLTLLALALALRAGFAEPARSLFTIAAAYGVLRAPTLLLGPGGGPGPLIGLAAGATLVVAGRVAGARRGRAGLAPPAAAPPPSPPRAASGP